MRLPRRLRGARRRKESSAQSGVEDAFWGLELVERIISQGELTPSGPSDFRFSSTLARRPAVSTSPRRLALDEAERNGWARRWNQDDGRPSSKQDARFDVSETGTGF